MTDIIKQSETIANAAWNWSDVHHIIQLLFRLPEDCVGFVGLAACAILHWQMGIASDQEIELIHSLEEIMGQKL